MTTISLGTELLIIGVPLSFSCFREAALRRKAADGPWNMHRLPRMIMPHHYTYRRNKKFFKVKRCASRKTRLSM